MTLLIQLIEIIKKHELDKKIFYHIHNPSVFEHLNFIGNFPNAKILYLFRNHTNDRVMDIS